MDPTERFQHALPFVLLPVSHPLAALHARRVASLQSSPPDGPHASDTCTKCGSYQLNSNAHIRTARSRHPTRKRHEARVLHRLCTACGSSGSIMLVSQESPTSIKRSPAVSPLNPPPVAHQPPTHPSSMHHPKTSVLKTDLAPKVAQKKKSALQDLLAKHKGREAKSDRSDQRDSGRLQIFLKDL